MADPEDYYARVRAAARQSDGEIVGWSGPTTSIYADIGTMPIVRTDDDRCFLAVIEIGTHFIRATQFTGDYTWIPHSYGRRSGVSLRRSFRKAIPREDRVALRALATAHGGTWHARRRDA